jgi:hypothetical protein
MNCRLAAVILLPVLAACSTVKGDVSTLKPTMETFHEGMKWKELRRLADSLLPERRDAFDKACKARDDEKNLFVTEYELEDCKVKQPEGIEATCYSKVTWYRLPSINAKTVSVATTLRWKSNQWFVDKQSDGPFAEDLSIGSGSETGKP